jgi:hypothetical protein
VRELAVAAAELVHRDVDDVCVVLELDEALVALTLKRKARVASSLGKADALGED